MHEDILKDTRRLVHNALGTLLLGGIKERPLERGKENVYHTI